jgi:formylglycine-generating enzyme required for sulfatase activity
MTGKFPVFPFIGLLATVSANAVSAPEMVRIPTGTFLMGSPETEPFRARYEKQHFVKITRSYAIQVTEVTKAQWDAMRDWALDNGYPDLPQGLAGSGKNTGPDHPVSEVSWFDCAKWLNAWSEREGRVPVYTAGGTVYREGSTDQLETDLEANGYRLPTEAEWEYACRALTRGPFYTGPIAYIGPTPLDLNLDACAWYWGNSLSSSHPIGLKKPNAFGLYDMIGNVSEWCHDWFGPYPAGPALNPSGPSSGNARVFRGGSWQEFPRNCRAATRMADDPGLRLYNLGFRPALTLSK